VDKTHISAVGRKSGGRLSLVVGGLDKRIKAIIPTVAHHANIPVFKVGRNFKYG
jgi:cephalosporin-C deacetylase-like acetyl esterase